jgi:hypothetical protein
MTILRVTRSRRDDISGGVDPTKVRLSAHFLLSDFMGCHSVYSRGLKNVFVDPSGGKIREGKHLCETILEPILARYGPLSVSYGYISPDLSRQLVTYQDPNLPSYHRWDKGAACDIMVHSWVEEMAPIHLAHELDEQVPYSRMITYSESPFICIASQLSEATNPRKAFYENRYTGKAGAKPLFIKKSSHAAGRRKQGAEIQLEHDWRGGGYPSYHGGGRRQMQHHSVSRYSVASDFLYSTHAITNGIPNLPTLSRFGKVFDAAGEMYDALLDKLDVPRLSIVRGFESFRFNDYPAFSWKEHFAIDFIPPDYLSASDVAHAAVSLPQVCTVSADRESNTATIIGWKVRQP